MLALQSRYRFYLYAHPTDMRKSFDGLCGIVEGRLKGNPLSGDVYIFLNRRRDRMKLLVWENSGFWIFYKRLERGTFQLPAACSRQDCHELAHEELLLMIAGIELTHIRRRTRYLVKKKLVQKG